MCAQNKYYRTHRINFFFFYTRRDSWNVSITDNNYLFITNIIRICCIEFSNGFFAREKERGTIKIGFSPVDDDDDDDY